MKKTWLTLIPSLLMVLNGVTPAYAVVNPLSPDAAKAATTQVRLDQGSDELDPNGIIRVKSGSSSGSSSSSSRASSGSSMTSTRTTTTPTYGSGARNTGASDYSTRSTDTRRSDTRTMDTRATDTRTTDTRASDTRRSDTRTTDTRANTDSGSGRSGWLGGWFGRGSGSGSTATRTDTGSARNDTGASRITGSRLYGDGGSTGRNAPPKVDSGSLKNMSRGQRLGRVDESTRQVKQNRDGGETHTMRTTRGQEIKQTFDKDGNLKYANVRDKSGRVTGQTYYNADGKATMQVSKHRDGRGESITKFGNDGSKTTVSTRTLKDGTKSTTTSVLRADGQREVMRSNGTREVWGKDPSSGRSVMMSRTERLSNGTMLTTNRTYNSSGYVVSRSYGNVTYNYHYNNSYYPGYHVFTPIYHPWYSYGYYYHPFYTPLSYSWGWSWYAAGSPYYGWFTPYPVYSSPSLWLTDYLIADMIESRYRRSYAIDQQTQAQQDQQIRSLQAQVNSLNDQLDDEDRQNQRLENEVRAQREEQNKQQARIDEEVKRQVSEQVKATMEIMRKNSQAADEKQPGAPALVLKDVANLSESKFDPNYVFAIHQEMTETIANAVNKDDGKPVEAEDMEALRTQGKIQYVLPQGEADTCQLSEGDLVRIVQIDPQNNKFAYVNVVSAAADSEDPCSAGQVVGVSGPALQEMLNEFAVRVQEGMDKMQNDPKVKAQLEQSK